MLRPAGKFQSTLSMRRATYRGRYTGRTFLFQSTLSMRRATLVHAVYQTHIVISIHALHEESDSLVRTPETPLTISIHALHEESDPAVFAQKIRYVEISIHALHEESDHVTGGNARFIIVFQSTLSMRRATTSIRCRHRGQ